MFNSRFSDKQLQLINKKNRKHRLFFALLFKYYEIKTEFFDVIPKFSGGLITSVARIINVPQSIVTPSEAVLFKYRLEIRNYYGSNKKASEEKIKQYVFETLSTKRTFDIEVEEIEAWLAQNKVEKIDNLRSAITKIVNNLLKMRRPELWSSSTTAVASDSTHFKSSDQNLISRWHPRYHSKGVMVYWHVDRNSVCIYSQLKSCAASEVSSMIEGILRHNTEQTISKNYVDTHGASEVGFTFSYILGFDLLPRLKNIHLQKFYIADKQTSYPNLSDVIGKEINWDIIEKYYDQVIKYSVSLKQGRSDAENIIRIFTRNNSKNPVYKALREIGRAVKTIFLCRYLSSVELRQEIHEGLNIVERWNGTNDFIFYGKRRTLNGSNPNEYELQMLCLHILQLSLVYINTLLLQQVLLESNWLDKMTINDKRALCPLLNEHINPYGQFPLNMTERININIYGVR